MILIVNNNVVCEIDKVNLVANDKENYVSIVISDDDSKLFFKDWLEFYSKQPANIFDEKELYIYDNDIKEVFLVEDAYISQILKSHTDWFGNKFDNKFEVRLGYTNYEEKKLRSDPEFLKYSNIYKSYIRNKKINQIIN